MSKRKEIVEILNTGVEGGLAPPSLWVSTGSTLLDLAISGGEAKGLPFGVFVEVFGPPSTGKSALLCEIAGNIQRMGGRVLFLDPEGRLSEQFARMLGFSPNDADFGMPDTVTGMFDQIHKWIKARGKEKQKGAPLGVFADSLAALTTEAELDEGDTYGTRRAKEFSQELRKLCRILRRENVLMVCSNQVRMRMGDYSGHVSPGGLAIEHYASLRIRLKQKNKLKKQVTVRGVTHGRVIGVRVEAEIVKSSIWEPFRTADLFILFDYGVDDLRANLVFVKGALARREYFVDGDTTYVRINDAIKYVEEQGFIGKVRQETIELWKEIDEKFRIRRVGKYEKSIEEGKGASPATVDGGATGESSEA